MKLEMNSAEATALFAGVANATRITELERDLVTAREERDDARRERGQAWERQDELYRSLETERSKNREVQREISSLRDEIQRMIDDAKPFKKERGFSKMFRQFHDGEKIQAIKTLRETLQIGLREAKYTVDGELTDVNYPDLVKLSTVFKGLFGCDDAEKRAARIVTLAGLLSNTLTTEQVEYVLDGNFHVRHIDF